MSENLIDSQSDSQVVVGRWEKEQHTHFLRALITYGKDWKKIQDAVQSRTTQQIRSHAQKYFLKLSRIHKEKRKQRQRNSIGKYKEQQEIQDLLAEVQITPLTPRQIINIAKNQLQSPRPISRSQEMVETHPKDEEKKEVKPIKEQEPKLQIIKSEPPLVQDPRQESQLIEISSNHFFDLLVKIDIKTIMNSGFFIAFLFCNREAFLRGENILPDLVEFSGCRFTRKKKQSKENKTNYKENSFDHYQDPSQNKENMINQQNMVPQMEDQ